MSLRSRSFRSLGALAALSLVVVLLLPLLALGISSSPGEIAAGLAHPLFAPALGLSLRTSLTSLLIIVVLGTPLAWWLAHTSSRFAGLVSVLVELPIVIPPAVVGVALLQSFGAQGLLGPALAWFDLRLAFSTPAVVLAQVVVAAPFFVQAAASAFRELEAETIVVARSLGASPAQAFFRVALPAALPGLIAGASLAWARALGEFGATLLFAGNLSGETQTLPLAIYAALQSELKLALVFSLVLASVGALLLLGLRGVPALLGRGQLRGERSAI